MEKNQLNSGVTMTALLQVEIPGAPAPYRLANYNEEVTFHGLTFLSRPFSMDALEDANSQSLTRLRITMTNVTQEVIALFEHYWQTTGFWTALIWWPVNMQTPDETPFTSSDVFLIAQATTDMVDAVADLMASGITLTGTIPKRRFTAASGFQYIPRRIG